MDGAGGGCETCGGIRDGPATGCAVILTGRQIDLCEYAWWIPRDNSKTGDMEDLTEGS